MMARMKLGQIVATRGVVGLMRENNDFAAFVHRAFQRYLRADWGELCESDRKQNDRALAHGGDRILAAYTLSLIHISGMIKWRWVAFCWIRC